MLLNILFSAFQQASQALTNIGSDLNLEPRVRLHKESKKHLPVSWETLPAAFMAPG